MATLSLEVKTIASGRVLNYARCDYAVRRKVRYHGKFRNASDFAYSLTLALGFCQVFRVSIRVINA